MGGFLRRLRRPKEEESEEPAPAVEEVVAEESMDGSEIQIPYRNENAVEEAYAPPAIEPSRAAPGPPSPIEPAPTPVAPPEERSEPDVPVVATAPASPGALATPDPAPALDEAARAPAGPASIEPRTTPEGPSGPPSLEAPVAPTPSVELPAAPPPPLPEADRDAATSSLSRHRVATSCFLCGTEVQGTYCPTCRMDWNE